jgi:hypothetical protein
MAIAVAPCSVSNCAGRPVSGEQTSTHALSDIMHARAFLKDSLLRA